MLFASSAACKVYGRKVKVSLCSTLSAFFSFSRHQRHIFCFLPRLRLVKILASQRILAEPDQVFRSLHILPRPFLLKTAYALYWNIFIHIYKIRLDSGNSWAKLHPFPRILLGCWCQAFWTLGILHKRLDSVDLWMPILTFCAEIAHLVPLMSKAVHLHRGHVELAKLYRSAGSVQALQGHQAASV